MTMKTSEFVTLLKENADRALFFEYRPGSYVRTDYHITEIKNVSYDTVDCGGIRNEWQEVHVQLWENETPEPEHQMDTSKAYKILQMVNKTRAIFQVAEIKFEYGNASFPTAVLPVSKVTVNGANLIVQLTPDQTTCKAKDRATSPEDKAVACCGASVKQSIPAVAEEKCSPDGGCC